MTSWTSPRRGDAINTESVNDGEEVAPAAARGHLRRGGVPDAGAPASDDAAGYDADAAVPHPDTALAAERLGDLQRLQAEYVNYKRRVDRDRALVQERAVRDVLESLLPVLDDIQAARDHGDLVDGPFAAIADKLEATPRQVRPDAASARRARSSTRCSTRRSCTPRGTRQRRAADRRDGHDRRHRAPARLPCR